MKVINVSRKINIQLNRDKIQYFVENVKFLGNEFSLDGVKPVREGIKAINELNSSK